MLARLLCILCMLSCGVSTAVAATDGTLSSSLFKLELMQAEGGDPEAQYWLAARFEDGNGVEQDLDQALRWYRRAADQGHPPALFKLGQLHEQGAGVRRDPHEALRWYKAAAELDNREAIERLEAIDAAERQAAREKAWAKQRAAEQARAAALAQERAEQGRAATAKRQAAEQRQRALARQTQAPNPKPRPGVQAPASGPAFAQLQKTILGSMWRADDRPAEQLPSSLTSCLSTDERQVVCFSRETERRLEGAVLTYFTKATLNNFRDDGRFEISYLFHVTRLDGRASGASAPDGLQSRRGWQEPALRLRCRAESRGRIRCDGDDGHALQFTAES